MPKGMKLTASRYHSMNFKEELVSSFEDDTPCPVPAPTLLLTTLDTVTGDMGGTLGPHPGF